MTRKQGCDGNILSDADIAGMIRNFLTGRNLPMEEVSGKNNKLQIATKNHMGINFSITQPKNVERVVLVAAKLQFHEFHFNHLKSMKDSERDTLLWNLREKLVFVPPSFMLDPPALPSSIQFIQEISYDEMTEGALGKALTCIARCVILVSWVFNRNIGVPPE
jgi:hypothetical protein